MVPLKVAILGAGCVGQAVGALLRAQGWTLHAVACRSLESAREARAFIGGEGKAAAQPPEAARGAEVILITSPDRAIRTICEEIAAAQAVKRGAVVLHCSGAHGPELLEAARGRGAFVAALHPIQAFPSPEQAVRRMKGTYFTFAGDAGARPIAKDIVAALGGRLVRTSPENRALYHAALCVLSNYLVTLADLGRTLLDRAGMDEAEAATAPLPLADGTLANLKEMGAARALTGPIARGDCTTIRQHLRAMADVPDMIRRLYCDLGLYTVDVARRKGTLTEEDARELIRILSSR
jgi:predicted short-subunit dehydrogenase-like oxidoreductase (DUF2520 family)